MSITISHSPRRRFHIVMQSPKGIHFQWYKSVKSSKFLLISAPNSNISYSTFKAQQPLPDTEIKLKLGCSTSELCFLLLTHH